MAPDLALRYSSAGPRDSWVGSRWSLALPSISRSLKHGTPTYNLTADLISYGGQDLVLVAILPTGIEYRTRRDSFVKIFFDANNDLWEVTQKDGTVSRFGLTANARLEGPSGTFEWLLSEVVDTNDNAYSVEYDRLDIGTAYPKTIRYTLRSNPATGALSSIDNDSSRDRRVDFILEPRTDVSESFLPGFERQMSKRLAQIDVSAAGDLIRRYELQYIQSPDTARSLLESVQLYGTDADAQVPTDPFETTFGYRSKPGFTGWAEDPNWTWPSAVRFVDNNDRDDGLRLGDVDGDGLIDLIKSFGIQNSPGDVSLSSDSGVYLNLGDGWSTTKAGSPWEIPEAQIYVDGNRLSPADPFFTLKIGNRHWGMGKIATDLTGDGRVDFLQSVFSTPPFATTTITMLEDEQPEQPHPLLNIYASVPWFENTGAGWTEAGPSYPQQASDWAEHPAVRHATFATLGFDDNANAMTASGMSRLADLNGDGLPDWIVRGTRSVFNANQTMPCRGGMPGPNVGPVATVATSYALMNLGGMEFDFPTASLLQDTLTIPDSPGGQNPACPNAPYWYSNDWQVCDPRGDEECKERLFHNRQYVKALSIQGINNPYVIKRHVDLGNTPIDINGDGLADHISSYTAAGETVRDVYINNGEEGFSQDPGFTLPAEDIFSISGNAEHSDDEGVRFADVNGDGRVDLIVARTQGGGTYETYLNLGNPNWVSSPEWEIPAGLQFQTSNGKDRGVRLADVNGDGMVDIVHGQGGTQTVLLNRGEIPDLLDSVGDPIGGWTRIEYEPSTTFDNTGGDGIPDLPQVIPVVSSILEFGDTNGLWTNTTTYSYEDGYFDSSDREFRGFGTVVATREDGRTTTTHFHQDDHNAGLVLDSITHDASQNLIDASSFTYTPDLDGLPPYTTLVETAVRSDPFPRFVRTENVYDDGGPLVFGNLTATIEYGEVNAFGNDVDPSDTRTREFDYNRNDAEYIIDRVSAQSLREGSTPGSGSVVAWSRFYYDGDVNGTAPPTKGNLTERTDFLNETLKADPRTTFTYDEYGNRLTITSPRENAGEGGGTTTFEYDTTFHAFVSAVENALGHRREYLYAPDSDCLATQSSAVLYPEGGGLAHIERGPNELAHPIQPQHWLRCYDTFGRLVWEEAPSQQSRLRREYQDDPSGEIYRKDIRLVDATGNEASTTTYIDEEARTYRVESDGPHGETIASDTLYDALGRIVRQYLPYFVSGGQGDYFTYTYDELDRIKTKVFDGIVVESFDYLNGWVTSTDANGVEKQRLADTFGNVVEVREISTEGDTTTTYEYDIRNLLTGVVDDRGNRTTIAYYDTGLRRSIDDPDSGLTEFDYDAGGNLIRRDNPLGFVTWQYDALDRPEHQRLNGSSSDEVAWTYDTAGNGIGLLASRSDASGDYEVSGYDLLGRALDEVWDVGGEVHDFRTAYTKAGAIFSRHYPGSPSRKVEWIRDARGFLTALRSTGDDYASSITWDALGRLTGWTAESGVQTTLGFDSRRLTSLDVDGAVKLEDLSYFYDDGDRVQHINDNRDPTLSRVFNYDDRNRLRDGFGPYGANQSPARLAYRYDSLGNLVCKGSATPVDGPSASECTSAGGKALVYPVPGAGVPRPHAPIEVDGQATAFDDAGNLTLLENRTYEYDLHGRIERALDTGVAQADFTYDGTGRLARIVDHSGPADVSRHLLTSDFEWNETDELARIHIRLSGLTVATHEEAYIPQSGGGGGGGGGCASVAPVGWADGGEPNGLTVLLGYALFTYLAWWLFWLVWRRPRWERRRVATALGLGTTIFVTTSIPISLGSGLQPAHAAFAGNVLYYHGDLLGSSVLTTDQAGAVVQRAVYKPFGEVVPPSGGSADTPEFGFTGQRFVAALGIYDYGARWYDPALGRFLQPDTIVPEPFDPQSLNRYSYVRNNPTNRIDPTGNFDLWGGFRDFFTVSVPSFFTDTLPGFASAIPSFLDQNVFDPFYSNLIAPVSSGLAGLLSGDRGSGLLQLADASGAAANAPAGSQSGGFVEGRFEPPGTSGAFSPENQARLLGAANFVGKRTDLAQEFGGGRLEDPVRFIRVLDLKNPGEYDFNGREHVIYLRPDALRDPGNLRSIIGHEIHHAYGTQFDTFGLDGLSERAANAWELRNASRLGVHPRYLDRTRILYEWYR